MTDPTKAAPASPDPRLGTAATDVRPPSEVLHQDAGMVSQADMTPSPDPELARQRRETINPSLAREEPPDTGAPAGTEDR
ncbi:hypothetical protein [Azospirillum thermophilum]|uniref:Uncharacterized protein n=1 Tax=Azospirillum thermophilum TaxID=2202148 RepID=A0A2S2CLM6_9PROT|nr:hypothetical protein [Azospirillum thermophilum]AWK85329.1 hypothetical protein DEW08_03290 [Azospirillum thermophilum]